MENRIDFPHSKAEIFSSGREKLYSGMCLMEERELLGQSSGDARKQKKRGRHMKAIRGTASDTLSDNPKHNEKNLDKAVDKMFKKVPPPPKK